MGTPIIEESEDGLLGIKFKMSMGPRDRWVGGWAIVPECHIIFSSKTLVGVDDLRQTSQVDAFLFHAKLLLLGCAGKDGKPDLHHLLRRH